MQLATAIAYSAVFIAVLIASGHTQGQPRTDAGAGAGASAMTIQARVEAREAQRRVALAEHRKRKEEFAKRCGSEPMSQAQLDACRAAYRRL